MSFTEIVDEIKKLSEDEQYELYDTLNLQFIGRKKEEFLFEIQEGIEEYKRGEAKSGTVDDFMKEFLS